MTNRAKIALVILIVCTASFTYMWRIKASRFFFEALQGHTEDEENSEDYNQSVEKLKTIKLCSCATCIMENNTFFIKHYKSSVSPFLDAQYSLTQNDFNWWKTLQLESGDLKKFTEAKDRFFAFFPSKPDVTESSPDRCLTCAVVGNSGNLKGSKYGSQIDAHNVIIRMNMAKTKGFEKDVGTKTTHRVMYPESAVDLDNSTHLVLFPFKIMDIQWITSAFTTGFHGSSYAPIVSKIKANKNLVMLVNPAFMKYVHTSWLSSKGRYPSTGFMTLVLAMHICDEVKVFGYGADKNGNWNHYWEALKNKNLKTGLHPGSHEYNLILELAKQKKVTFFRGW